MGSVIRKIFDTHDSYVYVGNTDVLFDNTKRLTYVQLSSFVQTFLCRFFNFGFIYLLTDFISDNIGIIRRAKNIIIRWYNGYSQYITVVSEEKEDFYNMKQPITATTIYNTALYCRLSKIGDFLEK